MQLILKVIMLMIFCITSSYAEEKTVVNGAKGLWKGEMNVYIPNALWGKEKTIYKVIVSNCDGDFQIWWDINASGYTRYEFSFFVKEAKNHYMLTAIYEAQSGKGWLENRYWAFVEEGNKLYVQWSRMVSNPGEEDKFKHFTQFGEGVMSKVSNSCARPW